MDENVPGSTPESLEGAFTGAFANPLPTAPPTSAAAPQSAPSPMAASGPVNVVNPDGQLVSIPGEQLQDALSNGYRPAEDHEVDAFHREEKYGSGLEQLKTGLEGAGEAATFGLSTGIEKAFGAKDEDIQARRETNPVSHMAGQVAGLVGSSLAVPGGGAAGLMDSAGLAAGKAVGLGSEAAAAEALKAGLETAHAAGLTGKEALAFAKSGAKMSEAAFTPLARIGSGAVKAAVDNAMFQSGDEVSKLISGDPMQSVGSAAADVGLAGLLGGALGGAASSVAPLWKATAGPKVEAVLKTLSNKAGGIEGVVSDDLAKAIDSSGIQLSPEIKSALSDDPQLQSMAKTLEQSDTTKAGQTYQQSLKDFREQAHGAMTQALGRDVDNLPSEISKYDHGKSIGNTLAKEYDAGVGPLSKEYNRLAEQHEGIELEPNREGMGDILRARSKEVSDLGKLQKELGTAMAANDPERAVAAAGKLEEAQARIKELTKASQAPGTIDKLSNDISQLVTKEGWYATPSSDIMKAVSTIQQELPNLKTLKDLTNYIKGVTEKQMSDPLNGPLKRALGMVKGTLRDAEENLIEKTLAEKKGAQSVLDYQQVRSAYRAQSELKDALDDRLHLRSSTHGYGKALREAAQMDGETILRRLSGTNDADILKLLQEKFPETAQKLKEYHVENLLHQAASKAKPGEAMNAQALIKGMKSMSPELRNFAIAPEAQAKIGAVDQMLGRLHSQPHNFSNTARTLDRLFEYVPASGAAMATMLVSHNPLMAGAMGALTKYLGKDVPDAARLGMLKFMGTAKPIDSVAFKSMVDTIHSVAQGERAMSSGVKNLFKAGREVLPQTYTNPSPSDRKKLLTYLDKVQAHPEVLASVGQDNGHYMPEHAGAQAQIATSAVNFLNSQRPKPPQGGPLDGKLPPSPTEKAHFDRMLDIANSPLSVLPGVKSGRVTPNEVQAVQTMYPGLYQRLSQKMMDQMSDAMSKGHVVPYNTRIGMSMFLGQPLDSSMTPQAILSNQPQDGQQQPQQGGQGRPPSQSSMKGLAKLPGAYKTPGQARDEERAAGK